MKRNYFFLALLLFLLFSYSNYGQVKPTRPIEPIGGLPSKKIDFCGAIKYKEQPVTKCQDLNHFINDEKGYKIHNPKVELLDRFGNRFCDYVLNNFNNKVNQFRTRAGHFDLIYPGTTNTQHLQIKRIVEQVFEDISLLLVKQINPCDINPHLRVIVEIDSLSNPNIGATGSSFYRSNNSESETWKALNGGFIFNAQSNSSRNIGRIEINTERLQDFYLDFPTDNNNDGVMDQEPNQLNLYQIVLHEALHMLGFATSINKVNGEYTMSGPLTKLNFFLLNENEELFNGFLGANNSISNSFSSLNSSGGCDVNFSGVNSNFPMHSDSRNNIVEPQSFSHFAFDSCQNGLERVMNFSISRGQHTRISEDEVNVLKNLGYTTTNTYGKQFLTHNSAPNPFYVVNGDFLKNDQNISFPDNNFGCNPYTPDEDLFPNNIPIVNACDNNNRHTITNQTLLDNDIISSSAVIIHAEVVNNPDSTISITTAGLLLETVTEGLITIRYISKNNAGYISNTSYFTIFLRPCDDFSENFGCAVNHDNCNVICNTHIIPLDRFNNVDVAEMHTGGNLNNIAPGWYPYYNNNHTTNNNLYMYERITHIRGGNLPSPGQFRLNRNQAIMTKVDLEDNTEYILSTFSNYNWSPRYKAYLGVLNNEYYILENNNLDNVTEIFSSGSQPSTRWRQNIKKFSTGDNNINDILIFTNENGTFLYLDDVQLIEDRLNEENIQTEYFNACNQTLTIGTNLCEEIFGINYSWYDVTNTSAIVRLTNGNQDLISDEFEPIGNGSQLQVIVDSNKVLELRRTFNNRGDRGHTVSGDIGHPVTIATNDADASIQVTLSCEPNPACNTFPLEIEKGLDANFVILTKTLSDSQGNLYASLSNGEVGQGFFLNDESISEAANISIKISENGCLDFIGDNLYINFIDKNDGSFYATNYDDKTFSKYDNNYNVIWTLNADDIYQGYNFTKSFYLGENYIYHQSNWNFNTNQGSFYIINKINGAIIDNWLININLFNTRQFIFSKNSNHFYKISSIVEQNYVEKYVINTNLSTINMVNSYTSEVYPPLYTYNNNPSIAQHTWYESTINPNNDNLFIFNPMARKIDILDKNLNILEIIDIPILTTSSLSSSAISGFDSNNNRFVMTEIGGAIYNIVDNGIFPFTSVFNPNLSFTSLEPYPLYYNFSHGEYTQESGDVLYSLNLNPGSQGFSDYISIDKIDVNTGQLLERTSSATKKEVKLNIEKTSFVTLFPNPTKNSITISSKKEIAQVQLLSKIGVPLISNNKVFNKAVTLSIENLPTDIYIVKVLFKDGTLEEQKVIKE